MSIRVVVTGLGLVTPLGNSVSATWQNACAGKSGIARISHFDATHFVSQVAGEVKNFTLDEDFISIKDRKKMGRFIQLGLVAAREALIAAGFANGHVPDDMAERIGSYVGSGIGGLPEIEQGVHTIAHKGAGRLSPFIIPALLSNLFAGQTSLYFNLKGPNVCPVSACATGAHSIGEAAKIIQRGEADMMLAGGAEAAISPLGVGGFAAMKALSSRYNDTPETASRPFDDTRDGFVIGEGAGVLVLERLEHAQARGANILAEVAGFGQTADAYHMTAPDPEGKGAERAVRLALADAQLNAADVDYINAHATSTPLGDEIESQTLERIFGDKIPVSATKSMTGHMLGAAGGVEAGLCVLALINQLAPPTINLTTPSAMCRLDYIPHKGRSFPINAVLNNSFGFGGANAALIFKKY